MSLCVLVLVLLHPGARLSPGLLAQIVCGGEESRAQGHGAAWDILQQLPEGSPGHCITNIQESQLPGVRALPGEQHQLSTTGSALAGMGQAVLVGAVPVKRCYFLKRPQGVFVLSRLEIQVGFAVG